MREKLIEFISQMESHPEITCPRPQGSETCKGCKYAVNENFCDMNARKADYLLANRVIVLPCKVGATLYGIKKFKSTGRKTVYSFTAPDIAWIIEHMSAFGKSIFLNREEAEKALEEHNNAND